jgi:deoxyribonuclease-4
MPLFGAHFSIAGGLVNAVRTAERFSCQTLQLFTKSAAQWAAKPLTDADVSEFRSAATAAGLTRLTAHDSYLINLAAPGDELFNKSVDAFVIEWERAERLGLDHLVTHPGSHVGSGDDAGLRRVIDGLNEASRRCRGFRPRVLLETTAGQGTSLGWRFEHLAAILAGVSEPERYGVCFDTCHVFAAGYDLRTAEGYAETFEQFDRLIGRDRIAVFHLNDSVKPLGSRVDRHAGLGLGEIGTTAFRLIVNDPAVQAVPMILETPKADADGREMDPVNLKRLRRMVRASS